MKPLIISQTIICVYSLICAIVIFWRLRTNILAEYPVSNPNITDYDPYYRENQEAKDVAKLIITVTCCYYGFFLLLALLQLFPQWLISISPFIIGIGIIGGLASLVSFLVIIVTSEVEELE